MLCISWRIKCLIIIDTRCKHEDYNVYIRNLATCSCTALQNRSVFARLQDDSTPARTEGISKVYHILY